MIVNRTSIMVMSNSMGTRKSDTCILVTTRAVSQGVVHGSFLLRRVGGAARRFNSIRPTKRSVFWCGPSVASYLFRSRRDSILPTDFDEEFTNEKTSIRFFVN